MSTRQVIVFLFVLIVHAYSVIVEIEDGKMEGTVIQSRKGAQIYAFRRIPFAKPPIGNLRFQPPVPNEKYNGLLDATKYGPVCMQPFFDPENSEDCLHLNVFTKSLGSDNLKPVIFHIHGGSFQYLSGTIPKPDYLLDRDVVLVTINYRLGPFGFLALGTKEVVGNMGLKDQALALKWVQKNIKNFGGDPNSVTIAGLSAGAMSATAHMVSDLSKGLFHKVIAMSGAITWQRGFRNDEIPRALELAKKLNCSTEPNALFQCLKSKTAQEISEAALIDFHVCQIMPWLPVLEPDFGQQRFFTDDPNNLFKNGNFSKVPVIIGITIDEYVQPVSLLLNDNDSLKQLNENFDNFAPNCFFFSGNKHLTAAQIASKLRDYYLPFEKIDTRSFNSLGMLFADGFISYDIHRFTRFVSPHADVYYYKFSFYGPYSFFNYPRDKPFCVHHGDDYQYVFMSELLFPKINQEDPENFMVERMTRIWEQFVWFGNPNNKSDEYLADMLWPKHDLIDEYFLDIGVNMIEKQGLFLERFSVWDDLEKSTSSRFEIGSKFICLTLFLIFKIF